MTLIGIDGGGTKTTLQCSVDDKIIFEKTSGPTNPSSVGWSQAVERIAGLLDGAFEHCDGSFDKVRLCLGLSGLDSPQDMEMAQKTLGTLFKEKGIERFIIVNDAHIAFASGSQNAQGIVLIAGTGSNCIAFTPNQEFRASGLGHILADEGSGYSIGTKVLKSVTQAVDGRGEHTLLVQKVFEHFEVADIFALKNKVTNPDITKVQVAQLAKLCEACAKKKDVVAIRILSQTAREITSMVLAVHSRAFDGSQIVDLVCVGSVARIPRVIFEYSEALESQAANLKLIIPDKKPIAGALMLARTRA